MSWFNSSWKNLEPETIEAIKSNQPQVGNWMDYYPCGCEESHKDGGSWLHLCDYHDGMDEGAALVRQQINNPEIQSSTTSVDTT